tara:strand:+ start:18257 stop:21787 length:3531 start_codon:yes stop_codon:yes gene_type:complete
MPKLIGQELQQYLIDQINIRQQVHGTGVNSKRTPEQISYLNSKTAWAKMASSVILEPDRRAEENIDERYDGKRLAKQHILSSGLSAKYDNENNIVNPRGVNGKNGFDNLFGMENGIYGVNPTSEVYTQFGTVPMPGIESIDVKALNRGSIKDITVKVFAYGPEQFKLIDLLYLRLGYTMFIEWGWSLYVDNEGQLSSLGVSIVDSDDGFFRDNFWNTEGVGFRQLYEYISDYRIATNGNYDAIVGKVVNYDWSVDDTGKYSITIKLKTFGDIIESLKCNLTPTSTVGQFINEAYNLFQSVNNVEGTTETGAVDANKTPPQPVDNSISAFLFLNLLGLSELSDNELTNGNDVPCTLDDKNLEGYSSNFVDSAFKIGNFMTIRGDKEFSFENEINDYLEKYYPSAKQVSSKTELENIQEPGSYVYIKSNVATDIAASTAVGVTAAVLAPFTLGTSLLIGGAIAGVTSYLIPNYEVFFKVNLDRSALQAGQDLKDLFYINYNLLDNAAAGAKTINPNGLYIRFGFLLDYIRKFIIPYDTNVGSNGGKILEIDTGVEENKMYRIPHQISLDPRVCVVRCSEDIGSNDFFEGLNPKQYYTSLPGWHVGDTLEARTMNIYLNAEHINKIIDSNKNDKGDLNLFKMISSLCTDINKALGGVNNLEPIIDEEKNTLNIVDGSLRRDDYEDAYQFRILGYSDGANNSNLYESNFVRNFDVKTELTNNLATTITIGATAGGYVKGTEATAFSKWNQGLVDPFKEKLEVEQEEDARDDNGDHLDPLISYKRDIWSSKHKGFGYTAPQSITEGFFKDAADAVGLAGNPELVTLSADAINSNIAIGTEFYKYINARLFTISDKAYSSPSQGFLPISFGLTMDGISGFKIYNSLNIDTRFLPKNYTNTMKFILKNVDHSIKNNDWETKLATVMVSRESIIRDNKILKYFDTYTKMQSQILDIIATDVSEWEKVASTEANKYRKKLPPQQAAAIANLERAFNEDQAPIINPTRQGAISYSSSPVARQQRTNKQENGKLKQTDSKVLVFIGETQGAAKYYINPATKRAEYMLHPSAAKAWYKWRDEMKTKGIPFRVSSAYRSVVHQEGLGPGNTIAKAGSSPHGWGGALDFGNLYRVIGGSGDPATNLEGRKTQAYYDIASIGAKYGWYNPHRLADNGGLDEIWHFEYWGSV